MHKNQYKGVPGYDTTFELNLCNGSSSLYCRYLTVFGFDGKTGCTLIQKDYPELELFFIGVLVDRRHQKSHKFP